MFPDFKTHKNTHTARVSGFQQGARMGELAICSLLLSPCCLNPLMLTS